MTKPFRFGVQVGGRYDRAGWRSQCRRFESMGYATLYAPDHFVDTELAPMVALAMAVEATDTLRVCALVLDNDYKHPAIVAKETATIDVLSDGRVDLGIGAGWMETDYAALGIPYDRPSVRIARLAEAIDVIRGCWTGEAFSFSGEHYTVTDYAAMPKPTQSPIPLLIGGGGEKVLGLAGREAQIVGINPNLRRGAVTDDAVKSSLAEETARKIEWVKAGAGERFDDLELQIRYFVAAITDDRRRLAEAVGGSVGLTADEALESGVALVGTVDEVCDILVERRERWGVSNVVVGGDQADAFAPVVERLAGT